MKKYGTDSLDFAVKVEVKYMRRSVDIIKNLIVFYGWLLHTRNVLSGSTKMLVFSADLTLCNVGAFLPHENCVKII